MSVSARRSRPGSDARAAAAPPDRFILVAAPPSMTLQWQDELEAKFGLSFEIIDRERLADLRRERGFGVNPWATGSRFIVSHRLLIDETYLAGLRDRLGEFRPRALLILDEAHHAAPASGLALRHRHPVHQGHPRPRPALRASAVPVGHAAQRALEQLLVAPGDARPAALQPRRPGPAVGSRPRHGAAPEGGPAPARAKAFPSASSSRSC